MNIGANNNLLKNIFHSYLIMTVIAMLSNVLGIIFNGIFVGNFLGQINLIAFGYATPIIYGMIALSYISRMGVLSSVLTICMIEVE